MFFFFLTSTTTITWGGRGHIDFAYVLFLLFLFSFLLYHMRSPQTRFSAFPILLKRNEPSSQTMKKSEWRRVGRRSQETGVFGEQIPTTISFRTFSCLFHFFLLFSLPFPSHPCSVLHHPLHDYYKHIASPFAPLYFLFFLQIPCVSFIYGWDFLFSGLEPHGSFFCHIVVHYRDALWLVCHNHLLLRRRGKGGSFIMSMLARKRHLEYKRSLRFLLGNTLFFPFFH